MPEREFDPGFERQVVEQLWAYSGQVLQPFDAVEIAHWAARAGKRPASGRSLLGGLVPAPVMWLLLSGLLLLALTATAFAAGWLRLPEPVVVPSPSPSAQPSPTVPPASPSPLPTGVTRTPELTPTQPGATASPAPITPEPSPSPSPSPSLEPSLPPTTLPTLGEWRRLDDFPTGEAEFLRVTDVAVGGPGLVAVGWTGDGAGGTEAARSWTSADGQTWEMHSSDSLAAARLEFIVSHGDLLFAFGPIPTDDPDYPLVGAYNVWRSPDGVAWEQLPQPAAFAEGAVLEGALSTGEGLAAYGYRRLPEATTSEPGVWTSVDGTNWQLADTLPDTYDVRDMAQAGALLVAMGNSRDDQPPWRSLAYSSDGGRNWQDGSASLTDDPQSTIEAVGAQPGTIVALGWSGRRDDIVPLALHSADGSSWSGGRLEELPMQQFERVVNVSGGFLAFGNETRFEIDPNCAPGPCEDNVPVAGHTWLSADGSEWHASSPLPAPLVWLFAGIAVRETGVVVTGFDTDFNEGIWFAPLASPLP